MNSLHRSAIALTFLMLSQVGGAQGIVDIEQFAENFMAAEKAGWEQGDFAALEALEHPGVKFQNIDGTSSEGWEAHKQAIVAATNSRLGLQSGCPEFSRVTRCTAPTFGQKQPVG